MTDSISIPDLSDPSTVVTRVDIEAIARSLQADDEDVNDFIRILGSDPLNYPHDDVVDLAWKVWRSVMALAAADQPKHRRELNDAAERLASGINGARRSARRAR